jgi:Uma2 family endonuclease
MPRVYRFETQSDRHIYEQILKVPHYLVYDKRDRNLRSFKLTGGSYQEQPVATKNPWMMFKRPSVKTTS